MILKDSSTKKGINFENYLPRKSLDIQERIMNESVNNQRLSTNLKQDASNEGIYNAETTTNRFRKPI